MPTDGARPHLAERPTGAYHSHRLAALGRWTGGLIWVGVGWGVIALVALAAAVAAYGEFETAPTSEAVATLEHANATYLSLVALGNLWIGLAGIPFILWLYRTSRQAVTVTDFRFRRHPDWAFLGWVVPIFNLYLPFRLAADVSRSTRGSVHPSVLAWWGLLPGLLVIDLFWAESIDAPDPNYGLFHGLSVARGLAYLGAALSAALMVRILTAAARAASESPPTGEELDPKPNGQR